MKLKKTHLLHKLKQIKSPIVFLGENHLKVRNYYEEIINKVSKELFQISQINFTQSHQALHIELEDVDSINADIKWNTYEVIDDQLCEEMYSL